MVSFIISSYERPEYLLTCLASLSIQTGEKELLVTCNSPANSEMGIANREVAQRLGARVYHTGAPDSYYAAEMVVGEAKGEWLCFPSDDSYYVPLFMPYMVVQAVTNQWDFIYCDMLYTSKWTEPVPWAYSVMDVRPVRHYIDKTCFLMKRHLFNGFPGKRGGAPCEADGELAEELVSRGVSHGKAEGGALVVHN